MAPEIAPAQRIAAEHDTPEEPAGTSGFRSRRKTEDDTGTMIRITNRSDWVPIRRAFELMVLTES